MNTSLFELFKIGIGPSSSHTVGPMRAALRFLRELKTGQLAAATSLIVDLYGSLALTGIGHATDRAILMGLLEESPDTVDLTTIDDRLADLRATHQLQIRGTNKTRFDPATDLRFHRDQMYPDPRRPDASQRHALHRARRSRHHGRRAGLLLHRRRLHSLRARVRQHCHGLHTHGAVPVLVRRGASRAW